MKSKIIIAAAVILVIVAAAVVYFTTSAYNGYSGAFDKSAKVNGTEYQTTVKVTVDGQVTTATGNFKIRDITSKVNFLNVMDINGTRVTQFTDGEYIYTDDGQARTKFKIGEKVQQTQKEPGAFDLENYIQEFSGLLDASKIKDLKIAEKLDQRIIEKITKRSVAGGTEYDVTLAAQLVNDIFKSIVNSEAQGGVNPECELKSFAYTAAVNGANYIGGITYKADMDVTFPTALTGGGDETKSIQLELNLAVVNPGTPASFTLPDTSGF
ncbi:MAG: hypothetical protein LBS62_12535 [Clostridiales bacterium]|nr:hypothetical protein [Clostridiales bacterium]